MDYLLISFSCASLVRRHGSNAYGVEDTHDDELRDEGHDMCQTVNHVCAHEVLDALWVCSHGHAQVTYLNDG